MTEPLKIVRLCEICASDITGTHGLTKYCSVECKKTGKRICNKRNYKDKQRALKALARIDSYEKRNKYTGFKVVCVLLMLAVIGSIYYFKG